MPQSSSRLSPQCRHDTYRRLPRDTHLNLAGIRRQLSRLITLKSGLVWSIKEACLAVFTQLRQSGFGRIFELEVVYQIVRVVMGFQPSAFWRNLRYGDRLL